MTTEYQVSAELTDETNKGDAAYDLCGCFTDIDRLTKAFKQLLLEKQWLDNAVGEVQLTMKIMRKEVNNQKQSSLYITTEKGKRLKVVVLFSDATALRDITNKTLIQFYDAKSDDYFIAQYNLRTLLDVPYGLRLNLSDPGGDVDQETLRIIVNWAMHEVSY